MQGGRLGCGAGEGPGQVAAAAGCGWGWNRGRVDRLQDSQEEGDRPGLPTDPDQVYLCRCIGEYDVGLPTT